MMPLRTPRARRPEGLLLISCCDSEPKKTWSLSSLSGVRGGNVYQSTAIARSAQRASHRSGWTTSSFTGFRWCVHIA